MEDRPHQRKGSISNAHIGAEFEKFAMEFFTARNIPLVKNYPLKIGIGEKKKQHCFDLGSDTPKIIVECKSHKWTAGGNSVFSYDCSVFLLIADFLYTLLNECHF